MHAPLRQVTTEYDFSSISEQIPSVVAPTPLVRPALPEHRVNGFDDVIVVQCTVLPDGSVCNVRTPDATDSDVANYAMELIRRVRFTPGTRNGKPVPMRVAIPYQFVSRAD